MCIKIDFCHGVPLPRQAATCSGLFWYKHKQRLNIMIMQDFNKSQSRHSNKLKRAVFGTMQLLTIGCVFGSMLAYGLLF